MVNAIYQHAHNRFIRKDGDTIKFNGFWRNGNKQNVCIWLNKASWHDAKTGEGGGCKEFARVVFNMTLKEFMEFYGNQQLQPKNAIQIKSEKKTLKSANALAVDYVDQVWKKICTRDQKRHDYASDWLKNERRITNPRALIGSGFANLYQEDIEIFDTIHHSAVKQRVSLGPNLIAPVRGTKSDKVENLFFRSLNQVDKEQKSRLLSGVGGWTSEDQSPRAFGFPSLIHEFPKLVICEGLVDYFAAEQLLDCDRRFLPIGAASASALPKWAHWLAENNFKGCVIIIFHIDIDQNGNLSDIGIGQDNAIKCANQLREASIRVQLFPWLKFMKHLNEFIKIRDLADSLQLGLEPSYVQQKFLKVLEGEY